MRSVRPEDNFLPDKFFRFGSTRRQLDRRINNSSGNSHFKLNQSFIKTRTFRHKIWIDILERFGLELGLGGVGLRLGWGRVGFGLGFGLGTISEN